jgi:hypothetical protein
MTDAVTSVDHSRIAHHVSSDDRRELFGIIGNALEKLEFLQDPAGAFGNRA